MRRKIGIEAPGIFSARKDGLDYIVINYILALSQTFPQYSFFVFTRSGPDDPGLDDLHNVHLIFLPNWPFPVWEQLILPRAVKRHKVHLLHAMTGTAPLRSSVPVVLSVQDAAYLYRKAGAVNQSSTWYCPGPYRRWNSWRAVQKVNAIVASSHYDARVLEQALSREQGAVPVVHAAVNEQYRHVPDAGAIDEIRRQYLLHDHFVLSIASACSGKSMHMVLGAYYKCWQRKKGALPKLVVVNFSDRELIKWQRRTGADRRFTDHIILTGYLENQVLQVFMSCAYLFLNPFANKSGPVSVLEAMASRTPVITGNAPAITEVAGDAAIVVDPSDSEQMADAVTEVLGWEVAHYQSVVMHAWHRARMFSPERAAKELMEIYDRTQHWNEPTRQYEPGRRLKY